MCIRDRHKRNYALGRELPELHFQYHPLFCESAALETSLKRVQGIFIGRVSILACWPLHLSHSMKVGIKIAVAIEKLGQMVVDLTVLVVDPFFQVWNEPCGCLLYTSRCV